MEQWEIDIREKYKDLPEGIYDLGNCLTGKQGFIEFKVALYRHYNGIKQPSFEGVKARAKKEQVYSKLTMDILEDFIKDLSEQKRQTKDSD